MAGNFAGVTTAGIHLNAIFVRGNAPKGLLWRLEGMDIPVPSHFAGSNVVNEKNLLSINFKFNFMGPFWHHPVDESATELTGEMIYAEDQPFTFRYSNFENIMT